MVKRKKLSRRAGFAAARTSQGGKGRAVHIVIPEKIIEATRQKLLCEETDGPILGSGGQWRNPCS